MLSLLEALSKGSKDQSDTPVWTFLNDHGDPVDSYTYLELENASTHLAEILLNSYKLSVGDRVLLVFFPGLDFTVTLLACFKAGLIGVPVFPPDPRKLKKDLHHFVNIQTSCGATTVLTNSMYNFVKKVENLKNIFSTESSQWPDLKWITVDDALKKGKSIGKNKKSAVVLPSISLEQIAFLQYTSGSTSEPKGVMISHGNLAHNLTLIIRELKADRSTVNVSWLPQYHDMGLIGSYLGVVYCGGTGYYISPISFLKDPVVWVKAMSRFKGTHTQAPNFAYALVSRKFSEAMTETSFQSKVADKLDLSSLRHMINAAEPVDFHAIMEFYRSFGVYGLPGDVVVPTYGLAEHTVFVCSGGKQVITVAKAALEAGKVELIGEIDVLCAKDGTVQGATQVTEEESSTEQRIVGCGYPSHGEDVDVVIVDSNIEDTAEDGWRVQAEGVVGEIWIASPSKAQGYWNQLELSEHEFHAKLSSDNGAEGKGYLRTGDLGFMLNSELFICGRMKDLIIVRGSNHYPQDIERTAEQHQAAYLRAGCSAAFSLKGTQKRHTEDVIYIAELKEGVSLTKYEEIARSVRDVVSTHHGLGLTCVCLLKSRTVPKTTSGKIARAWCRRGFMENTLQVLYRMEATESERAAGATLNDSAGDSSSNPPSGGARKSPTGVGGYSKVHSEDNVGTVELTTVAPIGPALSADEVRALPVEEVEKRLETLLLQVAEQGPSPLSAPVDRSAPVSALGLDSMTLVQYKGVIEKRFHCDIPDDFLFTAQATLAQLALAVHEGKLTESQHAAYEDELAAAGTHQQHTHASGAGAEHDPNSTVIMPMAHKQPCCPWFTWCM